MTTQQVPSQHWNEGKTYRAGGVLRITFSSVGPRPGWTCYRRGVAVRWFRNEVDAHHWMDREYLRCLRRLNVI